MDVSLGVACIFEGMGGRWIKGFCAVLGKGSDGAKQFGSILEMG